MKMSFISIKRDKSCALSLALKKRILRNGLSLLIQSGFHRMSIGLLLVKSGIGA